MSDDNDTLEIADEGAAEAPSVVEDAPTGYDWGELAEHDLVKRHGGDPTKIVQSYEALNKEFHARTQQPAEPEVEEVEWKPFQDAPAPANVDPEFYGRVEAEYRRNPEGAFRELIQGGPQYAAYIALVYDALEGQIGKFATQQLYQQIQQEQYEASVETRIAQALEEFQGQVTPAMQHVQMQIADVSITAARQAAPDFDEYVPRITEAIAKNPAYIADVRGDSEAMTERVLQMRDMFWAADQRKALTDASKEPAKEPAKATARRGVIGGNNASRPDATEREQLLRDSFKTVGRRGSAA